MTRRRPLLSLALGVGSVALATATSAQPLVADTLVAPLALGVSAAVFGPVVAPAPPALDGDADVDTVGDVPAPERGHDSPDLAAADARLGALLPVADSVRSPLDTLHMSVWERVWWGRRGLMRQTGLFPTHPDEPIDDLRQIAQVRRRMLGWHQTLGLVTVASMAVTVASGTAAALDRGSGLHKASLPVTIGLYSTTAALSLLSPPKPIALDREGGGIDSITIHRWLALAHVAGMIITPLIAEDGQMAHQAMGYATFATFSAAMLTVTILRR